MRPSYLWLLGCVAVLALALSTLGRAPGRREVVGASATAPAPAESVALWIRGGVLQPASVGVAKGARVVLTVTNTDAARAGLELPGYEERFSGIVIGPGASWRGTFIADRPGEDFAWMVNGKPAGRLTVAGSHLVEGHR